MLPIDRASGEAILLESSLGLTPPAVSDSVAPLLDPMVDVPSVLAVASATPALDADLEVPELLVLEVVPLVIALPDVDPEEVAVLPEVEPVVAVDLATESSADISVDTCELELKPEVAVDADCRLAVSLSSSSSADDVEVIVGGVVVTRAAAVAKDEDSDVEVGPSAQ